MQAIGAPTMNVIDLLRRFHEYADKWENHVATDEIHWVGNEEMMQCRKWYWQSDLREQTIAVIQQTPGA
jgi:hypothetical protein